MTRADVDLIDALDPLAWLTVAYWLQERPSTAARQACLQVLAAFLRWLHVAEPGLSLLAVTGEHLDTYCEQARAGTLSVGVRVPGRALASATVARKRRALSSFYRFAWSFGGVPQEDQHLNVGHPRVTRHERLLLRRGAARLAADGRVTEAVAIGLLEATGASADTLATLTSHDLHAVRDGSTNVLALITIRNDRGDVASFPVPTMVFSWLQALGQTRPESGLLIRQDDGRPVDIKWLSLALLDTALAGGMPEERAKALYPSMLHAVTVTALIEQARRIDTRSPAPGK
ncbi:hypothetical protein [Nonomuraea sp. NPDC049784]|uniref:hypothetical protein n=1 Tax=Nonomuraea sp. NPDC049784 TaxID=3154361 RepID=UPI0033CD683E